MRLWARSEQKLAHELIWRQYFAITFIVTMETESLTRQPYRVLQRVHRVYELLMGRHNCRLRATDKLPFAVIRGVELS